MGRTTSQTTGARARGAAILVGALVAVAACVLAAASTTAMAAGVATLHPAHIGATNPGFEGGTCPASPIEGGWGWHFVLPGNKTTFVTIQAEFENAGTVTAFVSHPTAKHAYVYTPGPDTLLGATATVAGPATRFNLSHVCSGSGTGTTTTTTGESTTTTGSEGSTTTTTGSEGSTTTSGSEESTTTESTESTTTTASDGSTTTGPSSANTATVLGLTLERSPDAGPAAAVPVQADELPRTGTDIGVLLLIGVGLLACGFTALRLSRTDRQPA
jgi:hypothetical protein